MDHTANDFSVIEPPSSGVIHNAGDRFQIPCGCTVAQTKTSLAVIGVVVRFGCDAHAREAAEAQRRAFDRRMYR